MKATELIAELQKLVAKHGENILVYKTETERDDDGNTIAYHTINQEIDTIDTTVEFAIGKIIVLS
jgi:hypothetical protein